MTVTISKAALGAPRAANAPLCLTKPTTVDLCIYRGDSGRLRVEVTDPDGLAVDVSAATWDCDIRTTADATTTMVSLDVVPVVGQTNAVDLVLSPSDSALLDSDGVWDLEMTLSGEVVTLLAGKVLVTKDVSRA